ncbi:MAG: hypothetical protein NTZ50_04390 [Chloroflexi bacterium]|nr:hypothetical protein [Chloroflexota bacterium]
MSGGVAPDEGGRPEKDLQNDRSAQRSVCSDIDDAGHPERRDS